MAGNRRIRTGATLRDVAEMAGVHPSTASRALNAATRALVNADTVARVLHAAEQLDYQPNSLARGLKTNRTFTVGMLLPDLTNPLFPPIVRGVEDTLGASDYTVVIGNTDNDDDQERSVLASMLTRRVDGLILATAHRRSPLIEELVAEGIPLVLVNRATDDQSVPSVTADEHAGVGLAVRHLVDLGHTRIGHVAGPQDLSTGYVRNRGFREWMERQGLAVDEDLVEVAGWYREDPGAEAFARILDRRPDVTAVVASNDLLALGCYDVLVDRGLSVGADVSVVGFNDMPFADKFSPPLTTIRIPHYELGVRAAEVVLTALRGEIVEPLSVRLAPNLVVRSSTGAPPAGRA